jgi:hypothetical protein
VSERVGKVVYFLIKSIPKSEMNKGLREEVHRLVKRKAKCKVGEGRGKGVHFVVEHPS